MMKKEEERMKNFTFDVILLYIKTKRRNVAGNSYF